MTSHPSDRPVSALRTRMIEDMTVRGFNGNTRSDYIRNVRAFAAFIGRSPGTATAEDLRRFQLHQTQSGMQQQRPPGSRSGCRRIRCGRRRTWNASMGLVIRAPLVLGGIVAEWFIATDSPTRGPLGFGHPEGTVSRAQGSACIISSNGYLSRCWRRGLAM